MRWTNLVNRADFCHKNVFLFDRDDFKLPKDKFTYLNLFKLYMHFIFTLLDKFRSCPKVYIGQISLGLTCHIYKQPGCSSTWYTFSSI